MPAREKGVPFDFDSPFQGLLQVTRKERSGWGRVSREGGGLGLRGTEGRPGIISRPSVQTHMCAVSPTLFTQAVPTARSAPGSPPWPVPTPYPLGGPTPGEPPLCHPPLPHHPYLPPAPSTSPRTLRPATLGQSLPALWAICQGDGSLSKKQENLLPSWHSCLLGHSHR